MNFLKAHKTGIAVAVIIILLFVGYGFFFGGSDEEALVSESAVPDAVGGDLIAILGRLQSLSLEGTVFSNPLFRSLVDFGIELTPEPVGRPNPFAPLGA
jgi:hypothetical protein